MTLKHDSNGWLKWLLLAAVLPVCWAWLGGGIFLMLQHLSTDDASPLTLYRYWAAYPDNPAVQKSLKIAVGIAAVPILGFAYLFLAPKARRLFGETGFASYQDIRKAGLLGVQGIIVGAYLRWYLVFGGTAHALLSAPTRSGKGVGIVIPNLLNWPDSVVTLDIKQENFNITSKYRAAHGQSVYLLNFSASDYRSHRCNPLSYIRKEDENLRISDVNKIANMLYPDRERTEPIWTATPRALFRGIVLMLLETPGKPVTLGQVRRESLAEGDGAEYFGNIIHTRGLAAQALQWSESEAERHARQDAEDYTSAAKAAIAAKQNPTAGEPGRLLNNMAIKALASAAYSAALQAMDAAAKLENSPDRWELLLSRRPIDRASVAHSVATGKPLSEECVTALNTYITITADQTRTGIITGFRASLDVFGLPLVDAATSGDDFDLRDLRKKRMSVYLGVTPDDLEVMAMPINLFFQLLIDVNTRETPESNPDIKHQCLLLLDEFPSIGKIPILSKGVAYIAGYWLRMLCIVQSPAQVVEIYGEKGAENFATNQAVHIIFPPKRTETRVARDISEWLGYDTVKSVSRSGARSLFARTTPTQSQSDAKRALLLPQEISSLGKTRQIVIMEDVRPIMARKIVYHQDKTFLQRLKLVSPTLAKVRKPKKADFDVAIAARELAAPVPLLNVDEVRRLAGTGSSNPIAQPKDATVRPGLQSADADIPAALIERPITADDIPNLHLFALENFAVDFSNVPAHVPAEAGASLDIEALHAYADKLCREAGLTVIHEEN
ncbi:type IV secretory system conjugative DNA transfer family protein [Achromobacter spanius]|uniref:type IV secretory system conjugative DNA transfer family protein n=1 Tax=Achromobacter spanius TaxID=217203 RepID=UPI00380F3851